mgnify:CR=1 FL=1
MRTAKVNEQGIVEQCIVGEAEWASRNLGGMWVNTEKKVGIGWTYDFTYGFRPPQPYPSWTWENDKWNAPVPYPEVSEENPAYYVWNEDTLTWDEFVVHNDS